jgi:signal transduction histidine kinase
MSFYSQNGATAMALDQEIVGALSGGLHQAAQPLTVLQGLLELALIEPHTEDEYRHSIQMAMEQSQRVTGSFDHVRELVRLLQPESDVAQNAGNQDDVRNRKNKVRPCLA